MCTTETTIVNYRTAAAAISNRRRFRNSNKSFSGGYQLEERALYGQLPRAWQDCFRRNVAEGTYVVYSYRTPIAWWNNSLDEWVIPDVHYSQTTKRQQSLTRGAVRS